MEKEEAKKGTEGGSAKQNIYRYLTQKSRVRLLLYVHGAQLFMVPL